MRIEIAPDVREYMTKQNAQVLIVDMRPNVTNPGCGCGATKTFYLPEIRMGFAKNGDFGQTHRQYQSDGVTLWISKRVPPDMDGEIRIFLEKIFFTKKLQLSGLDAIMGQ